MIMGYIMDLAIVAILVVGISALMGVMTNSIGEKLFGRKRKSEFVLQSARFQEGWKEIGGKKK